METSIDKSKLKSLIIDLWKNGIKNEFLEQGFMWERHFQAVFYHRLREVLVTLIGSEVGVWIEPVFDIKSGTVKPDIIITYGASVIAIIELKFKAWEYVPYEGDVEKLFALKNHRAEIALSVGDIKSNWTNQKKEVKRYSLSQDCLMVFAVVGKEGSDAFNMSKYEGTQQLEGLLRLNGFINQNDEVVFESVEG